MKTVSNSEVHQLSSLRSCATVTIQETDKWKSEKWKKWIIILQCRGKHEEKAKRKQNKMKESGSLVSNGYFKSLVKGYLFSTLLRRKIRPLSFSTLKWNTEWRKTILILFNLFLSFAIPPIYSISLSPSIVNSSCKL